MQIPRWSTLQSISINRAIRSASLWAVAVPTAAKFLSGVQDVVAIAAFGHQFSLHLALPFSWKVLFIVAVAFFVANVCVALWCPQLLNETLSFRDFADQQRSGHELERIYESFAGPDKAVLDALGVQSLLYRRRVAHNTHHSTEDAERSWSMGIQDAYAMLRERLDRVNPAARTVASLFYGVGFIGFAVLLGQNIWFVWQHW